MDRHDMLAMFTNERLTDENFRGETSLIFCEKLRARWDRAVWAWREHPYVRDKDSEQWRVLTGMKTPLDVARGE